MISVFHHRGHGVSLSFFFFMLLEHPPPPFTRGIPYTHPPSEGGKGDVAAIGLETLKELRGTLCTPWCKVYSSSKIAE